MPYEFYKVLHLVGLFLTLSGLVALAVHGGLKAENSGSLKKWCFIGHGLGILILLVSGFGLAARLNYMGALPSWIYLKLGIWVLVGGLAAFLKRVPRLAQVWFAVAFALFTLAAFVAVTKPLN